MSEPTSTSSPRLGSISDDGSIFAFDGAEALLRAWGGGLKPDPLLTVSEWADRYRMLSSRAAAEPGRYRTKRTPYMKEIMDALSPGHPAQRVVFMKAAQVGATEAGNCFLGFIIHQAPGPALAVQPTVELAKRNSRQRIDPLIEESPALRDKVKPARSRDAGNTMLSKEFAGGILIMTGANSAVGLRSTPARYIFLDEVDAYPASADEEGDPVSLAEARSLTFAHRRKVFLVSTPTIRGLSRIEREYEASDQRRYFVACPHCGMPQWLKFERLRWEKGKPETAAYACEGCDAADRRAPQDGDARGAASGGRPRPRPTRRRSASTSRRSTRRSAGSAGSGSRGRGRRRRARTRRSAPSATPSSARPGSRPARRRTGGGSTTGGSSWPAGTVPKGGLFLTAGADVQKDRIEVDVWAWGRGLESWLVDHVVIDGGPEHQASLGRSSPRCSVGSGRTPVEHSSQIARLAIDTGYEAPAVYAWARRQGFAQVAPVKGVEGFNRASPVSGPTYVDATDGGKRIRRGARLWTVAVSTFKAETYRFLRLERPTAEELAAGAHRSRRERCICRTGSRANG